MANPQNSSIVPWWRTAVIYQIYPRSFADANGDGIGDLSGIHSRLDYLTWLGVDALWLSPFYRSPLADFGYDVSDHCAVDPSLGTMADAEHLLAAAHGRGLKVILDFVPNHTSDQHPWFLASRASRHNPKRDWYIWRDPAADGGTPTNWWATFSGAMAWTRTGDGELVFSIAKPDVETSQSAWTLDAATGQYYLHTFLPQQPDLNWRNPAVVDAQRAVLRFWLARGADGFRIDAIAAVGKPLVFDDLAEATAFIPAAFCTDRALTDSAMAALRATIDAAGDTVMLGETPDPLHVGSGKCSLGMSLLAAHGMWRAAFWRYQIEMMAAIDRVDFWPGWVLSNHDIPRHAERYGSDARARAAAVLLLTLRGTPLLYAGEELGLRDAPIDDTQRRDPGQRDGCRAPIPWTDAPHHGWGPRPWLPWPANHRSNNHERLQADQGSILHLYRDLIRMRKASPALACGDFTWIDCPDTVLGYRRGAGSDHRIVLVNFAPSATSVSVSGEWVVAISTDPSRRAQRWNNHLGPDEAVILRR